MEYPKNSNIETFDIEDQSKPSPLDDNQSNLMANTRLGFIQKVYGILSCQLIFTFSICFFSMYSTTFKKFQIENTYLLFFCIIVSFIVLIMLLCFKSLSRKVPTNYILLFIFSFAEAYMVSFLCSVSDTKTVLIALVMTLGVTGALTFYAITTKTDFTMKGGLIYILSISLFFIVIFSIFTSNSIVKIIISGIIVVIYGIFLIYDTQLIIGGMKHSLDMDEYIVGALILYIDIITLFVEILNLLNVFFGNGSN